MTDHDRAAARREITAALLAAFDRRHDVLDAIVEADDRGQAVAAIAGLLETSRLGGEAVMGMAFDQLTKDARRNNAAELEDLDARLTFTLAERPASAGDGLTLRAFSDESDRELFAARLADVGSAGDGSGGAAGDLDAEIASARDRSDSEQAAWFVAREGEDSVGLVFGELKNGEIDLRVWIHPDHRKKGYGTAALRKSRSEMAAVFPGVPIVVRTPGALPS
ncbi:GNAT family N-acetyltransferase [Rhodococcoides kroppenstedtii]|uniref:GNAT family N-acetyltransferase n=1 Tax=Rhodococcoides kroppenstedtii TaxID=293050 RepID=UPI0028E7BB51|nr:GNAT family N-acetyltransferase [Rhodococcus kroppenstedtii]